MKWHEAPDLQEQLVEIVATLEMKHIQEKRIFCYRSTGAKTRAYARIWSFPKIFQEALEIEPAYVIEIVSEKFNRLKDKDRTKVLIHELLHIPKNFSGSLLPHKHTGRTIDKEVDRLFKNMRK